MPKLPILSGGEVIRVLETLGFRKLRQSGSHVILRMGNRGCVVPLHDTVKTETLAGILRQAGVASEDFIAGL